MKFCLLVTFFLLILWILNQFKGGNSYTTEASLTEVDMHQHLRMTYICFFLKFHEILFSGYLDMPPDGQTDRWTEPSAGDNEIQF